MAETEQEQLAKKALAQVRAAESGDGTERPENTPTANEGAVSKPRPDQPPSGALDAEGHRPVLERSRKVR